MFAAETLRFNLWIPPGDALYVSRMPELLRHIDRLITSIETQKVDCPLLGYKPSEMSKRWRQLHARW